MCRFFVSRSLSLARFSFCENHKLTMLCVVFDVFPHKNGLNWMHYSIVPPFNTIQPGNEHDERPHRLCQWCWFQFLHSFCVRMVLATNTNHVSTACEASANLWTTRFFLFCTGMAYLLCALDTDEIHAIILLLERFADRQTIDNWSERERESCTRLKAFRFEQLMPTGMSKVFKTHRRSNILWSPNGPARRPFHTHRMRKPTRTH